MSFVDVAANNWRFEVLFLNLRFVLSCKRIFIIETSSVPFEFKITMLFDTGFIRKLWIYSFWENKVFKLRFQTSSHVHVFLFNAKLTLWKIFLKLLLFKCWAKSVFFIHRTSAADINIQIKGFYPLSFCTKLLNVFCISYDNPFSLILWHSVVTVGLQRISQFTLPYDELLRKWNLTVIIFWTFIQGIQGLNQKEVLIILVFNVCKWSKWFALSLNVSLNF